MWTNHATPSSPTVESYAGRQLAIDGSLDNEMGTIHTEQTMVGKRFLAGALCAIAFGAANNGFAQGAATLVPKTENNISYVSGGVGKDEQELADAVGRYGY